MFCLLHFSRALRFGPDSRWRSNPVPDAGFFAKGDFQGFGANKKSKDWKTWSGECHGYEGLLNDNYYALLAVLDREAAIKENQRRTVFKAQDSVGTKKPHH